MDSTSTRPMPAARPRSTSPRPNDENREDGSQRKPNVRKRTKTGCLTCRKRRIKCDEAKPTCKNCIKSRRHCDGYNQRVIFKEPIGSLSAPFGSAAYGVGASHIVQDALSNHQDGQPSRVPLQAIAPRPPSFDFNQPMPFSYRPDNIPFHLPFPEGQLMDVHLLQGINSASLFSPYYPPQVSNLALASDAHPQHLCEVPRHRSRPGVATFVPDDENAGNGSLATVAMSGAVAPFPNTGHDTQGLSNQQHDELRDERFPSQHDNVGSASSDSIILSIGGRSTSYPTNPDYGFVRLPSADGHDEDRSMPDSEVDYQGAQEIVAPAMNVGIYQGSTTEVRTFGAYAASWAVSAYLDHPHSPEFWQNGLHDIFVHFVNVTSSTLALYEPRAFDQNPFQTDHVAGCALWKSAFPYMALRHPALLQSMLALASLQLAKLQKYSQAAALKHYHLALRRVGKIVQSELRRRHPATLAATLLLGYFEVWTGDHSKWSQHLWGARLLFREVPLKEMARRCLPIKRRRQFSQQRRQVNSFFPSLMPGPQPTCTALNYDLLSIITNSTVTPEDYGDIITEPWDHPSHTPATDKDVENFEIYSDLFWWYCKMDVYQSVLAGTKLFMEYEHWTQCPPRAPASNPGTPFGTNDHLILLMGRLADFAFKDRSRKRRYAGLQAGGGARRSPPIFPGMFPIQGEVRRPTGFDVPREASPQSDSNEDFDPESSLQDALREWESIRQAFQVFRDYLGPEFGKLDSGYGDLQDTPFGPAVQYRSYAIAGIWMNYYMGLINLYRSHPDMPPASLQAAGVQAAKTHDFCLELGRIAAGTVLDLSGLVEINTLLAAVLIESCFCIFVAGVQFRDSTQRQWLVRRMYDVSRLTGWQSARHIAFGCESAWLKAFEMKAGPPYARSTLFSENHLVWDNSRRIDTKIRELGPGQMVHGPLVLANADRAEFALGLLGVEEDLRVLELED